MAVPAGDDEGTRAASMNGLPRLSPYAAGLAVLVLLLAPVAHHFTTIHVTDPTLRAADGSATPILFPYSQETPAGQVLDFAFTIHKGPLTQRSIVFIPDDHFLSLVVNGRDVPLDGVDPTRRDDFHDGFRFGIGAYLERGDNFVVARVQNRGGPGGLDVLPDSREWPTMAETLACMAAFLYLIALCLRRSKLPWPVVILFVAGAAVRFGYLSVTPFLKRGHDVTDHIDYIEYLLAHHALPSPDSGGVFYQPPLYYALGAGLWKALTLVGIGSRETAMWALQVQSIIYQLGFLLFSIWTATLWLDRLPEEGFGRGLSSRQGLRALFVALLCFWPSGIIHSVRLGNDDLLYLCFGAGVYFASRWWMTGHDRDLNVAAGWGALGMLTKSNALLLLFLLGTLLGARYILDKERRWGSHLRRAWPSMVIGLASIGAVLGRAAVDTALGRRPNVLVGNSGRLNGDLAVANGAANYLWFDTKIFVTQPFTSPWDDAQGRQFFWNYALKSSLFGEFAFERACLSNLAVVISVLLLLLLACFALGISLSRRDDVLKDLPPLAVLTTLIVGLAALRMSIPKSCSNDFRYIFPVLTSFLYLYVRSLTLFRQRGWTNLALGAQSVGWSFAVLSATFFVVVTVLG